MAAQRKYPEELRERATRMAVDARKDPATRPGAFQRIGAQLDVHPEELRTWVKRAEIDGGIRAGTTSDDVSPVSEARAPLEVMCAFIEEHRGEHGLEPICRTLQIAPSTYYAHQPGHPRLAPYATRN